MVELHGRHRAGLLDAVDDPMPGGDLIVVPQSHIARRDTPVGRHRGGLGDDHAESAHRAGHIMLVMERRGLAVPRHRRIRVHRRQPDAVAHGNAAQRHRLEQLHCPFAAPWPSSSPQRSWSSFPRQFAWLPIREPGSRDASKPRRGNHRSNHLTAHRLKHDSCTDVLRLRNASEIKQGPYERSCSYGPCLTRRTAAFGASARRLSSPAQLPNHRLSLPAGGLTALGLIAAGGRVVLRLRVLAAGIARSAGSAGRPVCRVGTRP